MAASVLVAPVRFFILVNSQTTGSLLGNCEDKVLIGGPEVGIEVDLQDLPIPGHFVADNASHLLAGGNGAVQGILIHGGFCGDAETGGIVIHIGLKTGQGADIEFGAGFVFDGEFADHKAVAIGGLEEIAAQAHGCAFKGYINIVHPGGIAGGEILGGVGRILDGAGSGAAHDLRLTASADEAKEQDDNDDPEPPTFIDGLLGRTLLGFAAGRAEQDIIVDLAHTILAIIHKIPLFYFYPAP